MSNASRGYVEIDAKECKGCGLCIASCLAFCLEHSVELNPFGVHPVRYTGEKCSGCGICFYVCPEPGAITVYRLTTPAKRQMSTGEVPTGEQEYATAM